MIESARCKATPDPDSPSDPDSPFSNHQRMAGVPVPLEKELVELAFQIYEFFHEGGPRLLEELGKEPSEFVIFVLEQYPKPSRTTRSQTPIRPTYPARWIDNGVERRQIFRSWLKEITGQL